MVQIMADAFDQFLTGALAPAARQPDRQFVRSLQARIALEEQRASERRSLAASFLKQLAALAAVAAAVIWFARHAAVADWLAQSPAVALTILVVAFSFVLALVSIRPSVAAFARL
jgi:hypothetical protein